MIGFSQVSLQTGWKFEIIELENINLQRNESLVANITDVFDTQIINQNSIKTSYSNKTKVYNIFYYRNFFLNFYRFLSYFTKSYSLLTHSIILFSIIKKSYALFFISIASYLTCTIVDPLFYPLYIFILEFGQPSNFNSYNNCLLKYFLWYIIFFG